MKYHNPLYAALISILMVFFPASGMELATSPIQSQPTEQIPKNFSALRKAINENIKGNPKADELFIIRTIEEMIDTGILEKKRYYYDYIHNKETKPYIIRQFFTHYPQQICPELQLMINTINNFQDRQDFLTILSIIKTENDQTKTYIQQMISFIKTKEEASEYKTKQFAFSPQTTEKIHIALNTICSNLNKEYSSQEEPVIISKDTKEKISLITIIKEQQNILGYVSTGQLIHSSNYFKSFFTRINATSKADPGDETEKDKVLRKLWEQRLEVEAVACINAIIKQYPLIAKELQLIEERFEINSLVFLHKTIKHNEAILKQQPDLFAYYQQITKEEEPISVEEQPIITTKTTSTQPKQQQIEQRKIEQEATKQQRLQELENINVENPDIEQEEQPEPQASMLTRFVTAIGRGIASFFDYLKALFRWW